MGGREKESKRERKEQLLYCKRTACLLYGYNFLMRTSDGGKYGRQLASSPSPPSPRGGGGPGDMAKYTTCIPRIAPLAKQVAFLKKQSACMESLVHI